MAPPAKAKIGVGGELVWSGIVSISDDFQNLSLLLEAAGLSFVLEHPCRLLMKEVEEFFMNAKIKMEGRVLKSSVNNLKIKMSSKSISKLLKMPTVGTEDGLVDQDWSRTLSFCGLDKLSKPVRRQPMNDVGKLLVDILAKVFLCKTGSLGYISEDFFCLMSAIVCRKQCDWASILFVKIKECLLAPNFARIISLYLNQVNPEVFDMSKGVALHHLKKIHVSTIQRWDIRIQKPVSAGANVEGEPAPSANVEIQNGSRVHLPAPQNAAVPEDPAKEIAPSSVVPEILAEDAVPSSVGAAADIIPPPEKVTAVVHEDSVPDEVRDEDEEENLSTHVAGSGADFEFADADDGDSVQGNSPPPADVEGEKEIDASEQEGVVPGFTVEKGKAAQLEQVSEGEDVAPSSVQKAFSSVVLEEIPEDWRTVLLPPPSPPVLEFSEDPLLGKIEAMLNNQRKKFESSIKEVHSRISAVEKEMSRGLAQIQANTDELKRLVTLGGKALDHTIVSVGHVMNEAIQVRNTQNSIATKTAENTFQIIDEVGKFKETVIQTLSVEVRKGEDKMADVLDNQLTDLQRLWADQFEQLNIGVQKQISDIYAHTSNTAVWLHNEIFPEIAIHPEQAQFSPRPEVQSDYAPPVSYTQVWPADQSEVQSKLPGSRKRKYGEGPSASRSIPGKGSECTGKGVAGVYAEEWSPASRIIILDTFKLVSQGGMKVQDYYS